MRDAWSCIKSPQWHTLIFEEQVEVDMRVVCPQDVKMMLMTQAWMVYWKKWVAKYQCEASKRRSVAGANPRCVTKEDQRSADRQAPKCDEEACRRRRMGATTDCTPLVGQMKRFVGTVTKKKAQKNTGCTIVHHGGEAKPDPRETEEMGATSEHIEGRLEVAKWNHVATSV